jgi:hypothetical protein
VHFLFTEGTDGVDGDSIARLIKIATANPTRVSSRGKPSNEAAGPAVTLAAMMTWLRESTAGPFSAFCHSTVPGFFIANNSQ